MKVRLNNMAFTVLDHPLIKHKITNIRKQETKTKDFYQWLQTEEISFFID